MFQANNITRSRSRIVVMIFICLWCENSYETYTFHVFTLRVEGHKWGRLGRIHPQRDRRDGANVGEVRKNYQPPHSNGNFQTIFFSFCILLLCKNSFWVPTQMGCGWNTQSQMKYEQHRLFHIARNDDVLWLTNYPAVLPVMSSFFDVLFCFTMLLQFAETLLCWRCWRSLHAATMGGFRLSGL